MRKVAVMLVLSLLFVSVLQGVSSANAAGMVAGTERYVPLPGGGYEKTTVRTIYPSTSGAVEGAGAGAAGGAAIGSVICPGVGTAIGAGIGAIAGGIAGWIYGPAD